MRKGLLFLLPILTSCSVMMAADCKGANVKTIGKAMTRDDLINCGAVLVASDPKEEGKIDTFRITQERGSISRALLHGLLDITTGFVWELAATPIEMGYAQDQFYTVRVTFDREDRIQSIEIR